MDKPKNSITFRVWGRRALFTDPISKMGGEKFSYQVPTYEALKGILKSIYWKPTLIWVIDRVKIVKPFRTQSVSVKTIKYSEGGNDLSIYTYLSHVEYIVEAHFEWNLNRPELAKDRIDGKHFQIANRMLERGGRQDIFLGTRECQAYIEPCDFNDSESYYSDIDELAFGLMFHSFDYPDENGINEFATRFWRPVMRNGVIEFIRPEECTVRKFIRKMKPKKFESGVDLTGVDTEYEKVMYESN